MALQKYMLGADAQLKYIATFVYISVSFFLLVLFPLFLFFYVLFFYSLAPLLFRPFCFPSNTQ